MVNSPQLDAVLQDFLHEQALPAEYASLVREHYLPLLADLMQAHQQVNRPLIIGIHGCQGSGKSTLAILLQRLLTRLHGCRAVALSIDDFYLTRNARESLARSVHPLLVTRGVPGTHDISLMRATLEALVHDDAQVALPRFDKAIDDRLSMEEWETTHAPADFVLLEGWCLGTPAQADDALRLPVNVLEKKQDPDGSWRRYVNQQITEHYEAINTMIDIWIMLRAPDFDCVYDWRWEQEKKLAEKVNHEHERIMGEAQILNFIQHYQRLTEHALESLPARVHYLYQLDHERQVVSVDRPVAINQAK